MDELFIGSAICKVSRRGDLMLPTPYRKTARVRAGVPEVRLIVDLDQEAGCLRLFDRAWLNRAYRATEAAAEAVALGRAARDTYHQHQHTNTKQNKNQPNNQHTKPATARTHLKIR